MSLTSSTRKSCVIGMITVIIASPFFAKEPSKANTTETAYGMRDEASPLSRKINFVYRNNRRTPNPAGWIEYDGGIYNPERGYGWLVELSGKGRDRGADAAIELADGKTSTPRNLGRLELASWQGRADNLALVFRIDLPDGWYRVACASVDPGITSLPLVDLRSFKCRAHDVVFAGSRYGPPLAIGGNDLLEGAEVVEVTDGHLRIVVGDPSYAGWIWSHEGPWYKGWTKWFGHDYQYANNWRQKMLRRVDPGFHNMRLNSLEIDRVDPPEAVARVVFRDFFNRDNSESVNLGVPESNRWITTDSPTRVLANLDANLNQTAIKIFSGNASDGSINLLQRAELPESGIVRYSTRVSLFTGAGSKKMSGRQEAGILLLADPETPTEFNSTFIGVGYDDTRREAIGFVTYRVGDGNAAYVVDLEIPEKFLPFTVTEGEYEIVVEHDLDRKTIATVRINGIDITNRWPAEILARMVKNGAFGIRSLIRGNDRSLNLQQFYWSYQVEHLNES